MSNLTFGEALRALKQGKRVARAGWNGKGMFIYLNKGSVDTMRLDANQQSIDGISLGLFQTGDHGTGTRLPNIDMHTASGSRLMGWLASQTDMLAEDWEVLP